MKAENELDHFETLLRWLLTDSLRLTLREQCELNKKGAKQLKTIMEDEQKMDELRAYFNVLMWSDDGKGHRGTGTMLGFEAVEKMFHRTVEKYPELTRTITIYVYS